MPLKEAICTNCKGQLKINSDEREAVCPFCKTTFLVQDAINNYNTYVHNENFITANTVVVNDERSKENRLKAAEQQLRFGEWDKALAVFKEVCDIAPDDYRAWWGCARAETHENTLGAVYDFKDIVSLSELMSSVQGYYDKAMNLPAPATETEKIRADRDKFVKDISSTLTKKAKQAHDNYNQIKEKEAHLEKVEISLDQLKKEKEQFGSETGIVRFLSNPKAVTILSFVISFIVFVISFIVLALDSWPFGRAAQEGASAGMGVGSFIIGGAILALVLNLIGRVVCAISFKARDIKIKKISEEIRKTEDTKHTIMSSVYELKKKHCVFFHGNQEIEHNLKKCDPQSDLNELDSLLDRLKN